MDIVTTLDPVTLQDAPKNGPHLREGDLIIYFVSDESLNEYKNMHVERPGLDLAHNLDNPTEACGSDWN